MPKEQKIPKTVEKTEEKKTKKSKKVVMAYKYVKPTQRNMTIGFGLIAGGLVFLLLSL
jgi:hypothetical protein